MMLFKIAAPGIVKYVEHAGIGENGTVKAVISVRMAWPVHVSIVEVIGEDKGCFFIQYHFFLGRNTYNMYEMIQKLWNKEISNG